MNWPTWDQAAVTAVICGLAAFVLRRARPTRLRSGGDAGCLTSWRCWPALYSIWRLARVLPLDRRQGAIDRAP